MAQTECNRAPDVLRTERLLLRRFVSSDRAAYANIRSKLEVIRYLPGGVDAALRCSEVTDQLFARFEAQWAQFGFGPWALTSAADDALLGHCGLLYVPEFECVEILFLVDSPFWNRGYATEAAEATVEVAFTGLALKRLIGMASIENSASRRVLEKTGFSLLKAEKYRGLDVAFYELHATPIARS